MEKQLNSQISALDLQLKQQNYEAYSQITILRNKLAASMKKQGELEANSKALSLQLTSSMARERLPGEVQAYKKEINDLRDEVSDAKAKYEGLQNLAAEKEAKLSNELAQAKQEIAKQTQAAAEAAQKEAQATQALAQQKA